MNKNQARKFIRERPNYTWGDVKNVLRIARSSVNDFSQRSSVNRSFTLGATFNLYWNGLEDKPDDKKVNGSVVWFVAANVICDFGSWAGCRALIHTAKVEKEPHHEDPVEIGDDD